jgi:DNA gyrase subunit A
MDTIKKDGQKGLELLILSQNGYGKRSELKSYKVQKRGGSGIKTMKVTAKTGKLIGAAITSMADIENDIILTSEKGTIIRVPFKSVPILGRVTQGVRVMKPQAEDRVAAFTLL